MNENERKSQKLGMSISTAKARLHKMIIFSLAQELGKTRCCRCNEIISSMEEFSIDHMEGWFCSSDPLDMFFKLEHIGFSHKTCNYSHRKCSSKVQNKNGFKGVCFDSRLKNKPYRARIYQKTKYKHLGSFETAERAAKAYDEAAKKQFGKLAVTNESLGLI